MIAGTTTGSLNGHQHRRHLGSGCGHLYQQHQRAEPTGFSTLVAGNGAGDTFDIDANVAYTLDGGTGADSFVFSNGKVLTGSIDGGAGSDTVDVSAYGTAVNVSLSTIGGTDGFDGSTSGATNPITGGFNNINTVKGTATGSLTGANVTATWDLNAGTYTGGTNVLTFTGFNTLTGGSGADTFDINTNASYVP